jgi:hypothetical protein
MHVLLILSDVVTTEARTRVLDALRKYGECETLTYSSFAVNTPMPAADLHESLKGDIGISAGIQVLPLRRPNSRLVPAKVREWLDAELAYPSDPIGAEK